MRLVCMWCRKSVSTNVDDEDFTVRASIECPECVEKRARTQTETLAQLIFRLETNLGVIEQRVADAIEEDARKAIHGDFELLKELQQRLG